MKLLDLHCDTLSEMYKGRFSFSENPLHISEKKASVFSPYIQTAAIWSDSSLSDDEAWHNFFRVTDYFKEVTNYEFIKSSADLENAIRTNQAGVILACEGARILCEKIDRLDRLFDEGVRLLTLTWAGHDIIGGSHGTELGLTPFGKDVVEQCFKIGIIPDVSHASRKVTEEVLEIAKSHSKPAIATHSNSYTQHSHQRNLTDQEFSYIISLGGIVGISLAPEHLSVNADAGVSDVVRHIKHYINLGGISSVALGCDFDGISSTPNGLSDISRLVRLFDALVRDGLSEDDAERVFFTNAYEFLKENLL